MQPRLRFTKLYASRIACEVADKCIQIHRGYGYLGAGTDEIMLE